MLRKTFTITFLFLFGLVVMAQNKQALKPVGSVLLKKGYSNEVKPINIKNQGVVVKNSLPGKIYKPTGLIDTLTYSEGFTGTYSNFGFFGQDVMMQFFEAPTRMLIKSVAFACVENDDSKEVQVKLIKFGNGWTFDSLSTVGVANQGYFPSAGDGFNNIGAFPDEATGDWTSPVGSTNPFGDDYDLWSDVGFGWPIVPVGNDQEKVYQFVDMMNLAFEPEVQAGDLFAVVLTHQGVLSDQVSERIGFYALPNSTEYNGWKFYENGRNVVGPTPPGDGGWWSREFTWDFLVVVDYLDDVPPSISNITSLGTTLSTGPREVSATITDTDPSGNTEGGVTSASLQWSIDDGATWNDVAMTGSGDVYTGSIPGQAQGTVVTYRISATDNSNLTRTSSSSSYKVFQKENDVLLLYNTGDFSSALASALYIGGPNPDLYIIDPVAHDKWFSTDGTAEAADVMALYNYVVEISGSYPDADFSAAVKEYLDGASAGNPRNYFLSGQDYGCFITDGTCIDTTFVAGSLQYDYFGLESIGPQDLPGASVGLAGVAGDPLSGWVADYATANNVTYFFDPSFELGFTSYIDAITPLSTATAIFTTDGQTCGVRNEGENWKTAYITFDYAASNFRSDTSMAHGDDPGYAWGITVENQALKFLEWAGYTTDVKQIDNNIPVQFSLKQNYPNPFNPTTSIQYSIPVSGNVTLAIFDILGRKVTDLVNTYQQAGNFSATWNGTDQFGAKVTSGTYFYQLRTDNGFVKTEKMILLK